MSKKTSEARKRAFFAALAETGNQTISAERARVSRSWVSLHRSTDPEFRARMEAAIAAARASLTNKAGSTRPDAKWRSIDGEALVVRGSGGSGGGRLVQVARARVKQWTAHEEARFCTVLARTCNVKMACAAVGLSPASAYNHRDRHVGFERAWEVALQDGYAALEFALLENAQASLSGEPRAHPPEIDMPKMTADQALAVLSLHRATVFGHGKLPGGRIIRASEEEACAAIVKRLRLLERYPGISDGDWD